MLRTALTHLSMLREWGGFLPDHSEPLCVGSAETTSCVSMPTQSVDGARIFLFFYTCLCFIYIKKVGDKASIDVCLFYLFIYFNVTACQKDRQYVIYKRRWLLVVGRGMANMSF